MITCFTCSSLALQAVADIIRTTLGPRSMLKMLLDAAGGDISLFPIITREAIGKKKSWHRMLHHSFILLLELDVLNDTFLRNELTKRSYCCSLFVNLNPSSLTSCWFFCLKFFSTSFLQLIAIILCAITMFSDVWLLFSCSWHRWAGLARWGYKWAPLFFGEGVWGFDVPSWARAKFPVNGKLYPPGTCAEGAEYPTPVLLIFVSILLIFCIQFQTFKLLL